MKRPVLVLGLMLMLTMPMLAAAQATLLKMPDFSSLSRKATQSVDITLDKDMLEMAGGFMGGDGNSSNADISDLINGLQGISVHSFTFEKPGMYAQSEVDGILQQVNAPGWRKIVSVHQKGEQVEIHLRENAADGGLLIVTEEPLQLTVVNIAGKIDLDKLRKLQGHMGVPNLAGVIGMPH